MGKEIPLSPCCGMPIWIEISSKLGVKVLCMDKWYDAQGNALKLMDTIQPNKFHYYCSENPILQSVLSYNHIDLLNNLKQSLIIQDSQDAEEKHLKLQKQLKVNSDFEFSSKKISDKINNGIYKYTSLRRFVD